MVTPYLADLEAEEHGWYELVGLVRSLTPAERLEPGYYHDPDWTVRDVVGQPVRADGRWHLCRP